MVEFAGAAIDDLVGQFGEEGNAEEDGGAGEEDAAFVAAEPGEEAEKRITARITCVHDYYGSMSRIRLIWLAALLALCGSVAYLVAGSGKGMPRAGEVAPLFEGVDQNGARVRLGDVPVIEGVEELLRQDMAPGGTYSNMEFLTAEGCVQWKEDLSEQSKLLLCDAQTAGGLLISVDPERADELRRELSAVGTLAASVIGEVIEDAACRVYVEG